MNTNTESAMGNSTGCDRQAKFMDLLIAAGGLNEVVHHLNELKNTIGIPPRPEKVCEAPNQKVNEPSLVSVLNELPGEIRFQTEEIHKIISEISENLN